MRSAGTEITEEGFREEMGLNGWASLKGGQKEYHETESKNLREDQPEGGTTQFWFSRDKERG